MASWNPWHGCHKKSEGCAHCYVYRTDSAHDRDPSVVVKTKAFDLPLRKKRDGSFKIPPGDEVYTCFTSDFFVEDADEWRREAWAMIKARPDLVFIMTTKRIERFCVSLPDDWHDGYDNVVLAVTAENQRRADERLPLYMSLPLKHRIIICEPLLGHIDLSPYLDGRVIKVVAGGESGNEARVCDYSWILSLREQCRAARTGFYFKQTGARFLKDGKLYRIRRPLQAQQAHRANIDLPD